MSNNELTTLPKAVGYLCKIIKLNVANNQLQSLPAEIGTMNGINRLAAYLYNPALKRGGGLYRIWVVLSFRPFIRPNFVSAQYLENSFIEFIQILYVH